LRSSDKRERHSDGLGKKRSIHGGVGEIRAEDDFEFIDIPKHPRNNGFSAPEVTGWLSFLLAPIVGDKIGAPSSDGHNTAIQDANRFEATMTGVKASRIRHTARTQTPGKSHVLVPCLV
jgi:hypothetical protein